MDKANFPVTLMCRVLKGSRSGYYAWRVRETSQRRTADEGLKHTIKPAKAINRHLSSARAFTGNAHAPQCEYGRVSEGETAYFRELKETIDAASQPARFQDRPARGAARRGRASGRCPAPENRRRSSFRDTPKAGGNPASSSAGGRSAPMRSSADYGCMTCGTPPPVTPSCRERAFHSSASCSATGAIARRRATPTLPTGTSSRRRRRSGSSSPKRWLALNQNAPISVQQRSRQTRSHPRLSRLCLREFQSPVLDWMQNCYSPRIVPPTFPARQVRCRCHTPRH